MVHSYIQTLHQWFHFFFDEHQSLFTVFCQEFVGYHYSFKHKLPYLFAYKPNDFFMKIELRTGKKTNKKRTLLLAKKQNFLLMLQQ